MSVRSASLYKSRDKLIICANARVRSGYVIDNEPFVLLEQPVSPGEVGQAIIEVLSSYKSDIEPPESTDDFLSYFAMLAGFASYSDFMQGALYAGVEENSGEISFQPMKNDDGAFDALDRPDPRVTTATNHEGIGRAALDALERSR